MSSSHFSDYYKTITTTELLAILDNPRDYQSAAIEAAKAELESRQLSETALQKARQPLVEKVQRKEAEREKIKVVEEKLKVAGNGFFEAINPIQQGIPSTEKMIRRIAISGHIWPLSVTFQGILWNPVYTFFRWCFYLLPSCFSGKENSWAGYS
jgi:hypothetical protein